MFHRISNGLAKLRDVLSTYERFDSLDLVNYIDEVGVTDLTCRTPGGEVLFRNLTFRVRQGESLLIMGPSGSGAWRADAPLMMGVAWTFAPTVMRCQR